MNNKCIIAIMGPSGAGKSTLGYKLLENENITLPRHSTTRSKRSDDKEGFYRYLTHEVYRELLENNEFFISSGDGPEVKKEYGNFYGVLLEDCCDAWRKSDIILLFVSYKDIEQLQRLRENGINVKIVNLTFIDIETLVEQRLMGDSSRNHTVSDIRSRVRWALLDDERYCSDLKKYATTTIYTDIFNIEETYEKVVKELKLKL